MKDTATPSENATISFVDSQGRTITMPAPSPGGKVMKAPPPPRAKDGPAPPAAQTIHDTNLRQKIVDTEGREQEVAVTLRDDSVQEIFERIPSLLTRFGSTMVLGILLLVLTAMAFVQYPDKVSATAMIRQVATSTDGFSQLEAMINNVQENSESVFIPIPQKPLILGELQLPYQELLLAYEAYQEDKSRPELVATMRALTNLKSVFLSWKRPRGSAAFAAGAHFATMELPVANTAGLAQGQAVNLELAKYPVGQYGRLTGKVAAIKQPATPGEPYRISVALPMGLTTSHQFTIPYEEGLNASAAIITHRQSLLRKVLN